MDLNEMVSYDFSVTEIINVFYVRMSNLSWEKSHEAPGHYSLNLILEGEEGWKYDGSDKEYYAPCGSVVLNRKGISSNCYGIDSGKYEKWRYISIYFDSDNTELLDAVPDVNPNVNFKYYNSLFREAFELYTKKPPFYISKIKMIVTKIILSVFEDANRDDAKESKKKIIEESVKYLDKHIYDYSLNIEEIALKSGISEEYFRKIFKESYGISPVKYIINARLEYAKELLVYSDYTIEEISSRIGYSSEVYFYRLFKEKTRVTPTQFRNNKNFTKL